MGPSLTLLGFAALQEADQAFMCITESVSTFGLHASFLTRLEQMISCSVWQERTERARRTAVCFFSEYVAFIWSGIYTVS